MAKFLNTSGTNFFLEELIKNAKERLILISPYLRLNDRIKELLEDKDRLKIDIRIVYGKSDLHPDEIKWMQKLDYVRVSFCKNLHAKCYMNESECIISSLNLYEFSQVNNNEMGILVRKYEDNEVFKDAYEEAQRIIRISDEIRITLDEVKAEASPVSEMKENEEEINDLDPTEYKGGTIEGFKNVADLNRRYTYIKNITLNAPMLNQYMYKKGLFLLRLDREMTPTDAKKYEQKFYKVVK